MNCLLMELITVARDVLQSLAGEEPVFARVAVQKRINQLLTNLFLVNTSIFLRKLTKNCSLSAGIYKWN